LISESLNCEGKAFLDILCTPFEIFIILDFQLYFLQCYLCPLWHIHIKSLELIFYQRFEAYRPPVTGSESAGFFGFLSTGAAHFGPKPGHKTSVSRLILVLLLLDRLAFALLFLTHLL
jgi:hypothetical protein